jgi:hypothetical protein
VTFVLDELELETLLRDLRKRAPPNLSVDLDPSVTIGELVNAEERQRDSSKRREHTTVAPPRAAQPG